MLTLVEVLTPEGETLSLPMQDPFNGYYIKEIEGLDPVRASIVTSPFAQRDGSQYQNSRRENRNIVLKLGFDANYETTSVQSLRANLYEFFMPKTEVTLRFHLDGVLFVVISGRVETFESPIFTQDPEVSISVICFDPDFMAPSSTVFNGYTVTDSTVETIAYPGSVPTGLVFTMQIDRDLTEMVLYNRPRGGSFQAFQFSAILRAGDVLTFSTVSGSKGAILNRAGTPSSILYGVSPASNWINLFPGINEFRVVTEGTILPFKIEYTAKYGGL